MEATGTVVKGCRYGAAGFVEAFERDLASAHGHLVAIEMFREGISDDFADGVLGDVKIHFGETYQIALVFINEIGYWRKITTTDIEFQTVNILTVKSEDFFALGGGHVVSPWIVVL
jgi:hypothetical protein